MLLSAAIIVRDEADHLDGCLASLDGLVDEVVVVDTGSVDGSAEVAVRHGAVVAHERWREDFGAARNRALDLARGQWVLYVDADERVVGGDRAQARAWMEGAEGVVAGRVRFVPRVGWTPYREFRLWRNRPDVRFEGAMHETIVPAIAAVAAREDLAVLPLDLLTIEHLGYEGDQTRKHARDEPLLRAELRRRPERAYLYDHLARIREAQGDATGAQAAWRQGIAVARARVQPAPDDVLLFVDLVTHLQAQGRADAEVGALLDESLGRYGRLPTLELAAARHDFARGRPAAAAARVEWLLGLPEGEIIDTGSSYDRRVFGEWAWDLLGLCRFAAGDDAGAAEAFGRAEAAAPDVEAYAVRRRLAQARAAAG